VDRKVIDMKKERPILIILFSLFLVLIIGSFFAVNGEEVAQEPELVYMSMEDYNIMIISMERMQQQNNILVHKLEQERTKTFILIDALRTLKAKRDNCVKVSYQGY